MIKDMLIPWIAGALSLVYVYKINKESLRIDLEAIKRFLIFMAWVAMARAAMMLFFTTPQAALLPLINPLHMLGVFWEDSLFVLPLVMLRDFGKMPKIPYNILFVISALVFTSGHLYQGIWGLTAFAYPFVSAHYGRKYGFGTMILCHMMYDFITYYTAFAMIGM